MNYIPSEESEEINYQTEKSPFLNMLVLVFGALAAYAIFIIFLGILGETVAVTVPARYEASVFSFMDFKVDKKPWVQGQQLVDDIFTRNSIDPDLKPEIFLSCDDTVNAIALPGKKVIVFKGLLKDLKSLNSLYFVIGHEIGHIINRDHLKSIGRALAISLGLFFINVGAESNSFFSFNQAIVDRQFGQGQEQSSDEKAIQFNIKRFDGLFASHEFFDEVLKQEPNVLKMMRFMSTHPLTQDRIDKIKKHVAYNPEQTKIESFDPKLIDCPK